MTFSSALRPYFSSVLLRFIVFSPCCFHSNMYGIRSHSLPVPKLNEVEFPDYRKATMPRADHREPHSILHCAAAGRAHALSPAPRPRPRLAHARSRGPRPASRLSLLRGSLYIFPPFPGLPEENWMISVRSEAFWHHGGRVGREGTTANFETPLKPHRP